MRPPGLAGVAGVGRGLSFWIAVPRSTGDIQLLRRHPVVLARLAREFVASQLRGHQDGPHRRCGLLAGVVDAATADQAAAVLQQEEARLTRVARGVDLVEQALRDARFVPRL